MPSRHNTPCHRHDNRAVANTTRYPEGGTSRTLTGPEGTRGLTEGAGRAGGGTKQGESEPSRSNPTHQKQSRTKQPRKRQQQKQKANRNPRHHKQKPHRKHKDHKTPDTKGQPEQAEANRPHDTGPNTPPGERKQTRKKPRKHKANQSIAQTGGQTKRDNEKKRIKEYECTCPVCGQTHKYKRGQDLFMRRENRNKRTNVPVQFAGMHAGMHAVQKRSRP